MILDVVNEQNEKVGSFELNDEVFGGRPKTDLIWEAVVQENASARRGTHATKNRALVSGSGRKPWRQKGTGRARVGEIRNPLWRKGGTVFGPQPRDYSYALPRKVRRAALREAVAQKLRDGALVVLERLGPASGKAKATAELLRRLDAAGKTLVVDGQPDEALSRSTRNLAGVRLIASADLTARAVMDARRIVVTRAVLERLQEVLGS